MVALEKSTSKRHVNPMAATWTKAGIVRRAFKAGRQRLKDQLLSTTAGIHQACILLDEVRNAMHDAGLSPDDVQAALVLMTPETPDKENVVYVLPIPEPKKLPKLFENVAKVERPEKVLTLGIVMWQRDRESDEGFAWVQPFLTGPRAQSALLAARKLFEQDRAGGKVTFN